MKLKLAPSEEMQSQAKEEGAIPVGTKSSASPYARRARLLGRLVWLLIPVLAAVAFAPVLGMWFAGDDFGHLIFHEILPFPKPLLAFDGGNMFYRPVSLALTWNLGYALFGTNALPYHAVSLAVHALAAFLLGRAVAVIANDARVGWLAGALFAVYPLCTEPVAWLASQWDVFAAASIFGAVWGFAVAWRSRDWRPYAAGLACAFLAVTMKESALPLPLLMPFVALATTLSRRASVGAHSSAPSLTLTPSPMLTMNRTQWWALLRRIALWSLPFAVPSLLFVGLRLYAAGRVGGYPGAATDFQHFFWDALVTAALAFLMPLNRLVFSRTFVQTVGLLISAALLVGVIAWGKRRWPLLVLGAAWWLIFLAPALNLVIITGNDAQIGNRILYLSMAGFAIAVASIAVGLLDWIGERAGRADKTGRVRLLSWAVVGATLLAAIPITWIQLQPWVQASKQTRYTVNELDDLLAPRSVGWIDLNVTNLPRQYKGAYVFWNGLNSAMYDFHNQSARLQQPEKLDQTALAKPFGDTDGIYNLDFGFNQDDSLFHINEIAGVTTATEPPTGPGKLWDFRQCTSNEAGTANTANDQGWQLVNTATECRPGYTAFISRTSDGYMLSPRLDIDLSHTRWLRLGVSARYPTVKGGELGEWFWSADDSTTWIQKKSYHYLLDATQSQRVYWTYIKVEDIGKRLDRVRFDPVNDKLNVQIEWISLTTIER